MSKPNFVKTTVSSLVKEIHNLAIPFSDGSNNKELQEKNYIELSEKSEKLKELEKEHDTEFYCCVNCEEVYDLEYICFAGSIPYCRKCFGKTDRCEHCGEYDDYDPCCPKKYPDIADSWSNDQPFGLFYTENFISEETEKKLLDFVDSQLWNTDLTGRTQHYGYKYGYKQEPLVKLGEIPQIFLDVLGNSRKWFGETNDKRVQPDQVIVNEYISGQGINAHIDDRVKFGAVVASLTLNSGCEMEFQNTTRQPEIVKRSVATQPESKDDNLTVKKYLAPRSMVWLTKDARNTWSHQIRPRRNDVVNGKKIPRGRRVSITYRKVRIDQ